MHFYEYSRAAYAYARFLSTIEAFRRTQRVPDRITPSLSVDFIIEAPTRSSFPLDVLVPIAQQVGPALASVPLSVITEYVVAQLQKLTSSEEGAVIKAAAIELERERERTRQSEQETERIRELRKVVEAGSVNNQTAFDLVQNLVNNRGSGFVALQQDGVDANRLAERLRLGQQRQQNLDEHESALSQIDPDKIIRLTSKVRPQFLDMGLPLRKSADVVYLSRGEERRPFAEFDAKDIQDINDRQMDEDATYENVRVVAYDRDTGSGKLDMPDENLRRVSFSIPSGARRLLQSDVANAIDADLVTVSLRRFRDLNGKVTSVVIDGFVQS